MYDSWASYMLNVIMAFTPNAHVENNYKLISIPHTVSISAVISFSFLFLLEDPNFITLCLYSFFMTGKISSFSSLTTFLTALKKIHINFTKNYDLRKITNILPLSAGYDNRSGDAGKTQRVSVEFPTQVHALHSPPLTQSPSVFPYALIRNAGLLTAFGTSKLCPLAEQ